MDAHGGELCSRLRCLRRLRMPLDQQAKLVDAGIPLALLDQRKPLVQLRGGSLWVAAETFEHRVVILDRFGVIPLPVGYFAKVKLRASSQIIHRVVVNHVLKFAGRDVCTLRRCSRACRPERSPSAGESCWTGAYFRTWACHSAQAGPSPPAKLPGVPPCGNPRRGASSRLRPCGAFWIFCNWPCRSWIDLVELGDAGLQFVDRIVE